MKNNSKNIKYVRVFLNCIWICFLASTQPIYAENNDYNTKENRINNLHDLIEQTEKNIKDFQQLKNINLIDNDLRAITRSMLIKAKKGCVKFLANDIDVATFNAIEERLEAINDSFMHDIASKVLILECKLKNNISVIEKIMYINSLDIASVMFEKIQKSIEESRKIFLKQQEITLKERFSKVNFLLNQLEYHKTNLLLLLNQIFIEAPTSEKNYNNIIGDKINYLNNLIKQTRKNIKDFNKINNKDLVDRNILIILQNVLEQAESYYLKCRNDEINDSELSLINERLEGLNNIFIINIEHRMINLERELKYYIAFIKNIMHMNYLNVSSEIFQQIKKSLKESKKILLKKYELNLKNKLIQIPFYVNQLDEHKMTLLISLNETYIRL